MLHLFFLDRDTLSLNKKPQPKNLPVLGQIEFPADFRKQIQNQPLYLPKSHDRWVDLHSRCFHQSTEPGRKISEVRSSSVHEEGNGSFL